MTLEDLERQQSDSFPKIKLTGTTDIVEVGNQSVNNDNAY